MTQEWNNNGGEEDLQALGAEPSSPPPEPASGSGRKLKVNTSTLTLLLAFGTAVALLYLLGLHNKPKPASASAQAKSAGAQKALVDFLKDAKAKEDAAALFKDTEKLIKLVGVYFDNAKKPVELGDNPFGHPEAPAPAQATGPITPATPVETEDPDLRRVSREFEGLKVQLVMTGEHPAAIVNGKEVTIGSALEEFTVLDIRPDHLVLGWKDKKFTLPAAAPPGNQQH